MSYYRAVDSSQNDFLEHYGVKGMKWGERKEIGRKSKLGYRAGQYAEQYGKQADKLEARQKSKGYSSKRASAISNLRKRQSQLKKAQKKLYKNLSSADIEQGKRAVKRSNILKTAGLIAFAPGGAIAGAVLGGHRVYQENRIDKYANSRSSTSTTARQGKRR
jgi:hypothetical protein